jgi:endonuclease/exonuclease/phosphatase (EEP) superfamily protein YafD
LARHDGTPVIGPRLALAGCALVLALPGCGHSPPPSDGAGGPTYTLLQMNLCLSGLADCYARVAYPAGVDEAAALIGGEHPDAVTLSEACSGDVARIAARTGYRFRFARVIYDGAPFACIEPGGRGVFGDALLTRSAIIATDSQAFATQTSIEHRRWLCVTTRVRVDVCTAHLDTRGGAELAGNDAQCPELAAVLAHRPAARAVIFGGDVNRRSSCAPAGFWTRTDAAAGQAAGLQQVYGRGLRAPSATVLPFIHSDHDALLVRARLESRSR